MFLQTLLSDAALRYPQQIALIDGERTMTYSELERASTDLADQLQNHGASSGKGVGIYLKKSLESIIAVWAILQTGAAYVPLDPASPPKRLAQIAQNCQLAGII